MKDSYIGKSSTGKLHLCFGANAAVCSSSNKGLAHRPASRYEVENAKDSTFCRSCFPNGRPSDKTIQASADVKSEERADYTAGSDTERDDEIIRAALSILERRFQSRGDALTSPDRVRNFLTLKLAEREHEVFCAIFLDTKHRVIAFDELFRGTIDGASVHPREVVKDALLHNAAAVIIAHNHPSGVPEPSAADNALTRRLQETLSMVDIRLLDHFVIGGAEVVSFTERGLL